LTAQLRCPEWTGHSTAQLRHAASSIYPAWDSAPPSASSTPHPLPTITGMVTGPDANRLSQQSDQHRAASPHSGPLTNTLTQQTHLKSRHSCCNHYHNCTTTKTSINICVYVGTVVVTLQTTPQYPTYNW